MIILNDHLLKLFILGFYKRDTLIRILRDSSAISQTYRETGVKDSTTEDEIEIEKCIPPLLKNLVLTINKSGND